MTERQQKILENAKFLDCFAAVLEPVTGKEGPSAPGGQLVARDRRLEAGPERAAPIAAAVKPMSTRELI